MLWRRSWLYSLYKLSLFWGAIVSLPPLLLIAWYASNAALHYDRYRRATKEKQRLTAEIFQIFLHDQLAADVRRMALPERPATAVPTYSLFISRKNIDALERVGATEGTEGYVRAQLEKDGRRYEVRVRYRGQQYWNSLLPQKSLKIQIDRGDLLDGVRAFQLFNEVTPFGLEEPIILDLAQEIGLMTPEHHFAWLRLNDTDMGLYRYEAQPDEGLVRRSRRMPGSVFSGDASDKTGERGGLFFGRDGWQKVAWSAEDRKEDYSELERFLDAIQHATHGEFAAFAEAQLDLEKFARFDALDVVFGGNEHDYIGNQKLYYDPYRGRFEPIAWSFRGFQHAPRFNFVDHPLLVRLKLVPGYMALRDREVYRLLLGGASVSGLRARVKRHFGRIAGDLAADPYWDAYKVVPRISRFHRFMVRPMSADRWRLVAEAEIRQMAARSRYLLDELERATVGLRGVRLGPSLSAVELDVDGHAAYAVRRALVSGACAGAARLSADVDRNGVYEAGVDAEVAEGVLGEDLEVRRYRELSPGVRLVARPDADAKRGSISVREVPRAYRYFVETAGCDADGVTLWLESLVTNRTMRLRLDLTTPPARAPREATSPTSIEDVLRFEDGEESPHPWDYEAEPLPSVTEIGPGVVRFEASRTFGDHETVHIAKGTRIELGESASLVFLGRVLAEGTASAPIDIVPATRGRPFGGIAIQGPGTRGSRLAFVRISGGSRARHVYGELPGMVNIHDTADVALEGCRLSDAVGSEDVLHVVYVEGLSLENVSVARAPTDAIDLEMSKAMIRDTRVIDAGDECLDVMSTDLEILDSVLLGCSNNALSAGEESDVRVHNVLVSASRVGLLAKNASRVAVSRSLTHRTETALRTNRREVHYAGESSIGADELFAVDCETPVDAATGTRVEAGDVRYALAPDSLDYLRSQVLELGSWADLETMLRRARAEALTP